MIVQLFFRHHLPSFSERRAVLSALYDEQSSGHICLLPKRYTSAAFATSFKRASLHSGQYHPAFALWYILHPHLEHSFTPAQRGQSISGRTPRGNTIGHVGLERCPRAGRGGGDGNHARSKYHAKYRLPALCWSKGML